MLEPGITDGSAVAAEPSAATSEGPPDAPSLSSPAAGTCSAADQTHDRDGKVSPPSDSGDDTGNGNDNNNNNDDDDDEDEDDEAAAEEGANTTVFVGSIPFEASEADIVDFFSPCGPIANVKLLLDAHSRRFKGSCFIRFDSAEAAQQACALNGNTLMSRKLYISMSTSRPSPSSSPYVFIGNLDASLDVGSLYQFFAGCGTVVNIKLITDKYTGKHRGFGFVEFADDRSAKNSLALNGRMLGSRPIRIDFQRPKAPRSSRARGSGRGRADGHFGQGHHLLPHMHQHMAWPHAPAMQYGHPFPPNYHMHHPLSAQPHAGMPHPHPHGAAPAFFPPATRAMHHHHPHYSPHSPAAFPGYFTGHFPFPPHTFHMPPAPESPADHHAAPASPSTERAKQPSPPTSPTSTRHQTAPVLLPYAPMSPEAALASGFGFQMDPYLAYGAGPYAPNSYGPSSPPPMNAAGQQQPEHFE